MSEREQQEREMMMRKYNMEKNEETVSNIFIWILQKAKIRMYKEYKANQILELQMREQGVIAQSKGKKKLNPI